MKKKEVIFLKFLNFYFNFADFVNFFVKIAPKIKTLILKSVQNTINILKKFMFGIQY